MVIKTWEILWYISMNIVWNVQRTPIWMGFVYPHTKWENKVINNPYTWLSKHTPIYMYVCTYTYSMYRWHCKKGTCLRFFLLCRQKSNFSLKGFERKIRKKAKKPETRPILLISLLFPFKTLLQKEVQHIEFVKDL